MYDILIGLRGRYHQVGDLRKDNNNPPFSFYSVFVMFYFLCIFHNLFSTKRKINNALGNHFFFFEFDIKYSYLNVR